MVCDLPAVGQRRLVGVQAHRDLGRGRLVTRLAGHREGGAAPVDLDRVGRVPLRQRCHGPGALLRAATDACAGEVAGCPGSRDIGGVLAADHAGDVVRGELVLLADQAVLGQVTPVGEDVLGGLVVQFDGDVLLVGQVVAERLGALLHHQRGGHGRHVAAEVAEDRAAGRLHLLAAAAAYSAQVFGGAVMPYFSEHVSAVDQGHRTAVDRDGVDGRALRDVLPGALAEVLLHRSRRRTGRGRPARPGSRSRRVGQPRA